jgi:hypothetical protein
MDPVWPLSDFLALLGLCQAGFCWAYGLYLLFVGLLAFVSLFGFYWPFGLYQPLWHVWFYPAIDKVKLISNFTKQSMQPLLAFNGLYWSFGLFWPFLQKLIRLVTKLTQPIFECFNLRF